jgi:hypothetical protein
MRCRKQILHSIAIEANKHFICPQCHDEKHAEKIKREEEWAKKREEKENIRIAKKIESEKIIPLTIERFFERFTYTINSNTGCWENLSGVGCQRSAAGYWMLALGKKYGNYGNVRAHRIIYELFKGAYHPSMQVCHICDNPACINPDHLFLGTRSDNTQDAVRKNRINREYKRELNEHDVIEILNSKQSSYELGPQYNVTPTQIRRIKIGARWPDVYARWKSNSIFLGS